MTKNMGVIIPERCMCKFKACDTWTPATNPDGGRTTFYANNPYDPVVGVSTTECSGFDKMMSIYGYGITYGCKMKAKFMTQTVNSICYVKWIASNYSLPVTEPTLNELTEAPKDTLWRHSTIYAFNSRPAIIKSFKKIKAIERKSELEPDGYKFVDGAGPNKLVGVEVGYIPSDSTNTITYLVQMFIQITYYCKLFDRIETGLIQ